MHPCARSLIVLAVVGCGAVSPDSSTPGPAEPASVPAPAPRAAEGPSSPAPGPDEPPSLPEPGPAEPPSSPAPAGPAAGAEDFGRQLLAWHRAGKLDEILAHHDSEFSTAIGHNHPDLTELLASIPDPCRLILDATRGYLNIAIPPPMIDDSEAEVARKERLISRLKRGTELSFTCGAEHHRRPRVLFTIAVESAGDTWRILGWRGYLRR